MKIFGNIADSNGNPIADANIIKVGDPTVNVATATDGSFAIDDDSIANDDDFKISHINYETLILPASKLQYFTVVMPGSALKLEDVVISPKPKTTAPQTTIQKYKTPLIAVGAIGLIALGVFIIKKTAV